MLTVDFRQKYLKSLGLYDGEITGKENRDTKAAYKALQKKYLTGFFNTLGIYNEATDTLLINAYRVKRYTKNFDLEEFKCECGGKYCNGYSVKIDPQLLKNIQSIRTKFGSTEITSAVRCQKYNDSLRGSAKTSYHLRGKAIDFANAKTRTLAGRKTVMAYWKTLPKAGYTYCDENGNLPYMGTAVHIQIKD